MTEILVKKLNPKAILPTYAHTGDSGWDLYSCENVILPPNGRVLVSTGLAMAIPQGYEGCIRPRSGNALKFGYTVLNTPGTIDSNYRGEIKVILFNTTDNVILIKEQDRIAQMVIQKLPIIFLKEVNELDSTNRGSDGFGSTGK